MGRLRRIMMNFDDTMMLSGRRFKNTDGGEKTYTRDGKFMLQPIGGENFRLDEVLAAVSRGRNIAPMVYLVGEIIDKGESGTLDFVVTGVPHEGGLAGAVQLAIMAMFPENMRDRINVDCWGGSIASIPTYWQSCKAVFQIALTPYQGITLKYVDEYDVTAETTGMMPEFSQALESIFKNAEKFTFTETTLPDNDKLLQFKRQIMKAEKDRSRKIRSILSKNQNKVMFDGVIMTPGTYNGITFSAEVLKESEKYWQGNPIVINHEDETLAETAILGRQYRAWWNQDEMALETLGEVTEPGMVKLMSDHNFMPAMSPGLEIWMNDDNNAVEIRPYHLAMLVSYSPANPAAGVRNIIKD